VLAQVPQLAAFGPPIWRDPVQMANVDTVELTLALQHPEPGERVWIAETCCPVGLLHLLINQDYYQQRHAYTSNLIVREEAERQGIGRALLAYAEAWARVEGYITLSLSVFAQNTAARTLYQPAEFGEDIIRYVKPLGKPPLNAFPYLPKKDRIMASYSPQSKVYKHWFFELFLTPIFWRPALPLA
jgi:GNAT superfamily N-acetyltransferase